ncbi:MAG TPA: tetratricopeptide repeat protein, partial [Longimicrobiales bacterium]|nr:tetratricopeptide repeat protein [Longimicrobiales bacterium]
LLVLSLAALAAGCLDGAAEETTLQRGDLAFASGAVEEALAEYRLAARQSDDDPEALVRVGHAYVALGRVDEAADYFRRAVERDEGLRDQAVADLMHLARQAARDGESFQMASAVEQAMSLEPAIGLDDMALPLARHHFGNGEYGQALPLYQRALKDGLDSVPGVFFEIGRAYEGIGDCQNGLIYFEQFQERAPRSRRGEVDWFIGKCSFDRARELRGRSGADEDDLEDALGLVDRVLEVGEPRSSLGEAWFERGEILAALGRCEEAAESFRQVRVVEGVSAGALVQRAQERFDQITFGRTLGAFRPDRPCG